MTHRPLGVAIVGCGNIAASYARDLVTYPEIEVRGVHDLDTARAETLAAQHGLRVYARLEDVLDDPAVDIVVNLTIHHAHVKVITAALEAGKHVYSEKPLALGTEDARTLVELAGKKGLRLACSPATFLGDAQQTAIKEITDGRIGTVRVVYGECNWGRLEGWHPQPEPFFAVGPLFDVGVYPLTIATALFGPARRVTAFSTILKPERTTKEGRDFTISTPDFTTAAVELESGTLLRLTVNFYVGHHDKQRGMEFHGDDGSLHIRCWQNFSAPVEVAEVGGPYEPVPFLREPYPGGTEWGRGVLDLVHAIRDDRPHRVTGAHAAHVVEILCAIRDAAAAGHPVELTSTFERPAPMEWATA